MHSLVTLSCALLFSIGVTQDEQDTTLDPIINATIEAASDPSPTVRAAAIRALAAYETTRVDRFETVVAAIRDESVEVQRAAITAFRMIPGYEDKKVEFLLSMLADDNDEIRAIAYSELTDERELMIDQFVKVLNSNMISENHRAEMLELLRRWGPDSTPAVEAICELIEDRPTYRADGISCLAAIGPGAIDGVRVILPLMGDEDAEMRALAVTALAQIAGNRERLSSADIAVDERFVRFAASYMDRYDTNRNGAIEGDELLAVRGFEQFDGNGDFRITQREIERMFVEREQGKGNTPAVRERVTPADRR